MKKNIKINPEITYKIIISGVSLAVLFLIAKTTVIGININSRKVNDYSLQEGKVLDINTFSKLINVDSNNDNIADKKLKIVDKNIVKKLSKNDMIVFLDKEDSKKSAVLAIQQNKNSNYILKDYPSKYFIKEERKKAKLLDEALINKYINKTL